MLSISSSGDGDWLPVALEALRVAGCVVVTDVLPPVLIARARPAMYEAQERVRAEIGQQRLDRAGEVGVVRIMPRYDPFFLELIALPAMLALIDGSVSDTAIIHLQTGLILPPWRDSADGAFQHTYHRDFPRHLNGYLASVNIMLAIDPFTAANGGTLLVPGSHQRARRPEQHYLDAAAEAVECPAGSMIVFDSTLWHAAGRNMTGADRLAINHQYTRSFIKQQVDYVRALGEETVLSQPPRVQQLLGWYTRVVSSLDEYYRPPEERLYRAGQG
jgi:ectoine hydroxylase-related dioxygenase (phytanoyl-CoA dioxygenase family)